MRYWAPYAVLGAGVAGVANNSFVDSGESWRDLNSAGTVVVEVASMVPQLHVGQEVTEIVVPHFRKVRWARKPCLPQCAECPAMDRRSSEQ